MNAGMLFGTFIDKKDKNNYLYSRFISDLSFNKNRLRIKKNFDKQLQGNGVIIIFMPDRKTKV